LAKLLCFSASSIVTPWLPGNSRPGFIIGETLLPLIRSETHSSFKKEIFSALASWATCVLFEKRLFTMAKTEKRHVRSRESVSELPDWMKQKRCPHKEKYLAGKRIMPRNLTGKEKLVSLVDEVFLAYNSARLKEGCQLFADKMLAPDVTIGMSFSGALTPAGLGCSCIIPLIKAGFVDWIVSTGANLYHDMHFALNFPVHVGSFKFDDTDLRENDLVRIYDVLIPYSDGLMATDDILREMLIQPEFQKEMGTAELHYLLGKYCAEWERKNRLKDVSVLAAAYRAGVPCYTSSPGDSTIGMNVAGVELRGNKLRVNPSIDVNETTAFVLAAKREGGKSAVVLWGGGSPKNFMLQTEPQIQEVLRIKEFGQDLFLQVTDARPDTGGLSGATPSEAVSWGKVDPTKLPDAVVCYTDTTIAMPILTHYALAKHKPRRQRRLYDRREALIKALTKEYFTHNKVKMLDGSKPALD
jgi:deoxyhypusine synthase